MLTDKGWNGTYPFSLKLRLNANVTITFIYQTADSDTHTLFLTGYNIVGPTLQSGIPEQTMTFIASQAGSFQLLCLNSKCSIHSVMDVLEITVS